MKHAGWLVWLVLGACGGDTRGVTAGGDAEGDDPGECTDGEDNDGNGSVDCEDAGCAAAPDCTEADPDDAPPSAPVVAITPAAPTADDDLVCTVVEPSTDPEGATVTTTLAWLRDGAATGLSVETVPAAQTAAGDSWTCEATGHDGTQAGPVGSASVAIAEGNRAPSAPEVAIHPSAPATNQPVTCVVETAPVDPDGDAVTVSFSWAVDGADAGITGDTLARADTAPGEEWTCVATASDGVLTSPEAVATAAITEARYTGDITGLGGTTHTASSCFLGCSDTTYQAANAFDDNRGTAGYSTWHATWTGGPEWIAVDFGAGNAWAVTRYGLMGASFHEGYRVRDFSLQGSDDGVTWNTVDTVTNASLAYVMYGGEPLSYWDVDNEDAYRHWRYLITDNEGGQPWADEVGIVEIEMFADEPVE